MVTTAVASVLLFGTGFSLGSITAFAILWALVNLTRTMYQGAHGGYIGTYMPLHLRTRVTGICEFAWGVASFAGLPLIGAVVQYTGESALFFVNAAALLVSAGVFAAVLRFKDTSGSSSAGGGVGAGAGGAAAAAGGRVAGGGVVIHVPSDSSSSHADDAPLHTVGGVVDTAAIDVPGQAGAVDGDGTSSPIKPSDPTTASVPVVSHEPVEHPGPPATILQVLRQPDALRILFLICASVFTLTALFGNYSTHVPLLLRCVSGVTWRYVALRCGTCRSVARDEQQPVAERAGSCEHRRRRRRDSRRGHRHRRRPPLQ